MKKINRLKMMLVVGMVMMGACMTKGQQKEGVQASTETSAQNSNQNSKKWPMVAFFPRCDKGSRCALPEDIFQLGDTKQAVLSYLQTVGATCASAGTELPDHAECNFLAEGKSVTFTFSQNQIKRAEFILCKDVSFPSEQAKNCLEEALEPLPNLFATQTKHPSFQVIINTFAKSEKSEEKTISSQNALPEIEQMLQSLPLGQELLIIPTKGLTKPYISGKMAILKYSEKENAHLKVTLSFTPVP